MSRIREWMHGKGRWVVIAVMILLALWIIVDFYRTTHVQTESQETVGGGTQNQDSPDTETTNEDTKDSGMTTTEEDVGTGSEACRTE